MSARAVALALLALAPAAAAQDGPDEAARRELIAQAEERAAASDHARALELARRAATLRPSPSLTWLLAREHRALGQLVEALDLARACVRAADADAALRNRDTIRQACEAVRASVEPHLARVEVAVEGDPPEGLVLRLGGRVLPPALRGVAVPVMPGAVRVEAEAPGFRAVLREESVAEGEVRRVALSLEREPVTPPTVVAPPAVVAMPVRAPLSAPRSALRGAVGPAPWVLGGAGLAALAFAGAAYGVAQGARSDRDDACTPLGCRDEAAAHDARYVDWLAATNAALVAGGVLVASGIVWYVAARVTGRADLTPRPATTARLPGFAVAF